MLVSGWIVAVGKEEMKRETAIKALAAIAVVSLIVIGTLSYDRELPSCNSTLPGCGERFFNRTTAEDVERAGGILERSMGEIVEGIVNR